MSQSQLESNVPNFYKVSDLSDRIARVKEHYESLTIQKLHEICPSGVKKSNIKPEMIDALVQYWT